MILRSLRAEEIDILKDFLYEAIFIPEGIEPPDRSIIEQPELALYYGHVDDETPSFAISLYKEYRGKGIGTELMKAMLHLLQEQGFKKASLAVQKANFAVKMYQKVGFEIVDENDEEFIMVWKV